MTTRLSRRSFGKIAIGSSLAAAMVARPALAAPRTFRLSHHLSPGHLVDVASHRFAELLAEATDGELKVDIFPSSQIAGLRQGSEAVQIGTVDLVWSDFGTLANFRPEYGFVSLPFLFRDDDHFDQVFGGEVGTELADSLRDNLSIETLGYGNAGFRVVATRETPVNGPEDLHGIRIRVPEVPIYVDAFRAVGANPTPMAWGEVYTALQTGVIDAVENPAENIAVESLQEVTHHLSRTYHIMTDVNLFANSGVIQGLSDDQQEAVMTAARTALSEFNTNTREAGAGYWDTLSEAMETVESPDRAAFQEAMSPVWDGFRSDSGDAGSHWIDAVTSVV